MDKMVGSVNIDKQVDFWFPGRWLGGLSMVIAPVLLLSAEILRIKYNFFFPDQLLAFEQNPARLTTAYSLFLAGNILLWPAIMTLSKLIGQKKPGWALWGGTFVILGLFARTFHYGVNHLAFQMVKVQNLETATKAVADSYGAFHIVATLSSAIMFGWIIMAIGSYLSGTLGILRSVALGLMAALMLGVLKGSSPMSVISTSGLCVALVPLGIKVLTHGPNPGIKAISGRLLLTIILLSAMFFLGQAG